MSAIQSFPQLQETVARLFQSENFLQQPAELYAPIDYTLQLGGKRIRPVMLLASCQLFNGDIAKAYDSAVGIEVFHNFTLLHDDLMDHSPLRRGVETVYRKWDENTAILSGDAMLIMAYQYLCRKPSNRLHDIISTFNNMANEVMMGQQYDMNFESRDDVTVEEYLDMIYLKTAALFNGALRIGALIADAEESQLLPLHTFGRHLGLAFQIQDDLLDTFGNVTTFGKKPGQDIRDNKKTMLLITALHKASPSQLDELQHWMAAPESDEKVEAVRAIYNSLHIAEDMEQHIASHYQQASQALESINTPDANKQPMKDLMQHLLHRSH